VAEAMDADSRARFDALLDRTDGTPTMALALARPMRRDDNILVLA
jgi:hypothetical protein